MKRQRRTLGLLVVWLMAALVAIGPRMPLRMREKAATTAELKPVVARPKNRASFLSSNYVPVLTGSLASLATDPRHSSGVELARKINVENDGLSQMRNPAWRLKPDDRRRPRMIGWTILGQQAAAAIWKKAARAWEFESPPTLHAQSSRLSLAVSGWSGCVAYRWNSDELAQRIELARPANGRRERRLRPVHLAAIIGELSGELGAILGRGAQWWDQAEWAQMAGYLRREAALASEARSVWRSAKAGSQAQIGL